MKHLNNYDKQCFYFWPAMLESHNSVVIFGGGGRGTEFSRFLRKHGITTRAFLDNDPRKHNTTIDDIPVLAPDDISIDLRQLPLVISCFQRDSVFLQCASLFGEIYYDYYTNEYFNYVDQLEIFEHTMATDLALLHDEESRKAYAGIAEELYSGSTRYRHRSRYRVLEHPVVHAQPGDVVLGIGANTGNYIIKMCDKTRGDIMVHAFEPNNYYFPYLCANIYNAGYQDNCRLHCAGIWKDTGVSFLSNPFDMARGRVDETSKKHAIFTWSIDEYTAMTSLAPDLIEVERAGLENVLLQCAKKTITTHKPRLIIKICPGTSSFLADLHALVPEYTFYFCDHDLDVKKSLVGFLYAIAQ